MSQTAAPVSCAVCAAPLTGGRDTFGAPNAPGVCAACWLREADHGAKCGAGLEEGNWAASDSWTDEVQPADLTGALFSDVPTNVY